MTGEEWPSPGSSIFQVTSRSSHLAGMRAEVESATPEPLGPRKRGQSSAGACAQIARVASKLISAMRVMVLLVVGGFIAEGSTVHKVLLYCIVATSFRGWPDDAQPECTPSRSRPVPGGDAGLRTAETEGRGDRDPRDRPRGGGEGELRQGRKANPAQALQ